MKSLLLFCLTTLLLLCAVYTCESKVIGDKVHVFSKQVNTSSVLQVIDPVAAGKFFSTVIKKKRVALNRIQKHITTLQKNRKLHRIAKQYQISALELFKRELNDSEFMIVNTLHFLNTALQGDYKDILYTKDSAKLRLDALKDAIFKEEQEYRRIIEIEKKFEAEEKHRNHSKVVGIISEILADIEEGADKLESELDSHAFDSYAKLSKQGDNIEAVIKIENGDPHGKINQSENDADVVQLVDAENNMFVLSRGKDTTVPHEDHYLIMDINVVVITAMICSWLCVIIQLPAMFGYILSGIILGPSGINYLTSLVQLESLGEFAVFFILFSVGLEFSPEKLKKTWRVSVLGSVSMMVIIIIVGILFGFLAGISVNVSAFVAACLALSSTPLVVKFLDAHEVGSPGLPSRINKEPREISELDYGTTLLGILIMQDIMLGLLIAILPSLSIGVSVETAVEKRVLAYVLLITRLLGAVALVTILAAIIGKFVIGNFFTALNNLHSKEMMTVGTIGLSFLSLLITDKLHISMELGCFLAGVMISCQGTNLVADIKSLIHPVRDFFSILFFASVGLHVFPSFVAYELTIVVWLTFAVIMIKFIASILVLMCLIPRKVSHLRWIVSGGLAQVSEFSFVLGSRAKRLHLINREAYLLIVSITSLSLLFAPFLWRWFLWYFRLKRTIHSAKTLEVEKDYRT